MSCDTNPIERMAIDWGGEAPNATLIEADSNSPALFVSNAPEQVGEGNPGQNPQLWEFGKGPWNLCRAHLTDSNVPTRVRVFLWHVTRLQAPSYWAVRVGSNGTGGTVSNLKSQVANELTGNLAQHGMCFADAQLFGTLNPGGGGPWDITTEQTIWSVNLPVGSQNPSQFQFVGCILEFDVSATEFTIRSVVSKESGSFGTFATQLAPRQNNWPNQTGQMPVHVRGYWLRSRLRLDLPGVFDCNPVQPPGHLFDYDFCSSTGAEKGYFSEANSLAMGSTGPPIIPGSSDNPGAYGANLSYTGHYKNSGSSAGRLYVAIRARNTGGKYFGAGRVVLPSPAMKAKLPPIPDSADQKLMGYDLTSLYPEPVPSGEIIVPADDEVRDVEVVLANGGACATPANIVLSSDGVWPVPPE